MDEKFIAFQDEDGKPAYREATPEEIAAMQAMPEKSDWLHDYPLRIVAPEKVTLDHTQFIIWLLFSGFPIEKIGDNVHIYCYDVEPETQTLIDSLNGVVTIEKRYGTNH